MNKENQKPDQNQIQVSLPLLSERIANREQLIDSDVLNSVRHAMSAIQLAFEQGDDLLEAKKICAHGEFQKWVADNFPKSYKRAWDYMKLAAVPKVQRASFFENETSIRGAMKVLDILPESEPAASGQENSIRIPKVISNLTFISEWVSKSIDEISGWEQLRRDELKIKLSPIVELHGKL
jgi:hypothetical protein